MTSSRTASNLRSLALPAVLVIAGTAAAQATPVGTAGYTVTTFAAAPMNSSAPDSITLADDYVFVGYGNNGNPDGSGGAVSTIAKYTQTGKLLGTTSVTGHNDGLRYNPSTGQIWALQNEDANSNIVLINPGNLSQSAAYNFTAFPHGGGYDDAEFMNGKAFISASNPTINPNTAPALVSATLSPGTVNVTGVLSGNATVKDISTGKPVQLNLQDPDSLNVVSGNTLALDSQADAELVFITNPGSANQSASVLNLSNQVDDTVFTMGHTERTLLFADKGDNTVYEVTGIFAPGTAYSAAASNSGIVGTDFIGELNLTTGVLTPIVTGANNPGGEAFLPVPAPGSFAMLAVGLLGVFGIRRRARRIQ